MINIFILNWNSSTDIECSLNNIQSSKLAEYRVILIDNNSSKIDINNLHIIYRKYKDLLEIHLVFNKENYGYTGGNNKGYEYIKTKKLSGDILILNPDIILSNNTLFEMSSTLVDNVGAVMPRTLNNHNTIICDYIKLDGFKQYFLTTEKTIVETDYVAGYCMLLKRSVIDEVGLLDESFFMYWEEIDLALRIKDKGYNLISTTNTTIIRKGNSDKRYANAVYFYIRNPFILSKKYNYFSKRKLFIFIIRSFIS